MAIDAIFGSQGQLTWLQECARAGLIFFYGLVLLRIAGRRAFARWAALDIIVSILVGSNLSRALTGQAELWGTLAATTLLIALHWLLSHAAARIEWLSRLLEGRPIRLAAASTLDDATRKSHAVTRADLSEALHAAGLTDLAQTELVMLEPSGRISVVRRS